MTKLTDAQWAELEPLAIERARAQEAKRMAYVLDKTIDGMVKEMRIDLELKLSDIAYNEKLREIIGRG